MEIKYEKCGQEAGQIKKTAKQEAKNQRYMYKHCRKHIHP